MALKALEMVRKSEEKASKTIEEARREADNIIRLARRGAADSINKAKEKGRTQILKLKEEGARAGEKRGSKEIEEAKMDAKALRDGIEDRANKALDLLKGELRC